MSGWDEFNEYRENRPSSGGFWVRLENKTETRLRFFSEPHAQDTVWVKDRTGKNMKIVNPSSEIIERINNEKGLTGRNALSPRRTWLLLAYNRATNSCGIYEAPMQVMSHLAKFRTMEEYGPNIAKYDISIDKDTDRNPTYTAQALPPKELSDDEKALMRDFREKVDFAELTATTPEEDIVEALGLGSGGSSSGASAASSDDDDFLSSVDSSGSNSGGDDFLEL